jgi:SOS-response transcriptional repressor LexA
VTYSTHPDHLTPQARRVLHAIWRLSDEAGRPPTLRELGAAVGLRSVSTVHSHVVTLSRLGYVRSYPDTARGCYLTASGMVALGQEDSLREAVARLQDAARLFRALDAERIDHPYAWAVEALRDIAESLEVPA